MFENINGSLVFTLAVFAAAVISIVTILSNKLADRKVRTIQKQQLLLSERAEHERTMDQLERIGLETIAAWLERKGYVALEKTQYQSVEPASTNLISKAWVVLVLILVIWLLSAIVGR